jgi:ankyrin repeat protein
MTRRENTLAHEAARCNNPELIQALKASNFPIDTPNNKHLYPLHWAAFYGSERALKALLVCGHNVDCADGRGMTPLHVAIKRRFIAGVRVLLEHGASPMACISGATSCRDILESMNIYQEFDYLEIKELLDEYQNNSFFSQVLILA